MGLDEEGIGVDMVHVFVDLEMCGADRNRKNREETWCQEIIEIGAVKLDDSGEELDQFRLYVKPELGEISEYYSNFTGISNEMVAAAPIFCDALGRFLDWCGDEAKIYSWSPSDLIQIQREAEKKVITEPRIDALEERWIDFQKEFGKLLGIGKKVSLKDAVNAIGAEFEGQQHDAFWDARNTAEIYRLSLDRAKFDQVMKPLVDLFKPRKQLGTSLGDLFGSDLMNLLPKE